MNWENILINLGNVKEKSRTVFKFKSVRPLDIEKVKPSCGACTYYKKYNPETGELKVTFKSGSLPKHLAINPGYQYVRKALTVTYTSGEVEVISFTAKIVK